MVTRCHSVRSWRLPSRSFQFSDVATRRLTTSTPLGMERDSGSAPRLPTRITLFTPAIRLSSSKRTAIGLAPSPSSIDAELSPGRFELVPFEPDDQHHQRGDLRAD